ncbi:acyl carrier protein [Burkholderia anthina]|uniref:acyl carrier protein n=1 Tax=Burkholderia anthina TaxID=179879 RepID=UPI001588E53A|nr:acyl carrier protein [Burkholderia anthina]
MPLPDLETRVAQLVETIILTSVESDTLLIESGLVDSLSAVDVTLAVEREFGVKIPPSEIDVHLESVHALAQYVALQRQRQAGPGANHAI